MWSCKTDDILRSKTTLQWRVNERSQSLSTPNQSFVIELNIPGLLVWSAGQGFIRSWRRNSIPRFNQIVSRNFVWRKTNQHFLYNVCKMLYQLLKNLFRYFVFKLVWWTIYWCKISTVYCFVVSVKKLLI